ncbi:putative bifunctional diguanylate cyclase/phosphodiesterase [Caulobacter sp. ErkDOM-YI]|uniref:putative bifunctional diguanylate cyclase/phosphodiesterase n=1 Tax=unclassified Caulobacter TaxID=2648921 RepID=UPI003AF88FA9
MAIIKQIVRLFAIRNDRPELLIAQATAFSSQAPMMYLVVLINAIALSATHFHAAPPILTIGGPLLLALASGWRMLGWRRLRKNGIDAVQAEKMLRGVVAASAVLSIAFTSWSLSLYPYGDAFQQSHVAFYMAITVIACIFCLMHLRAAALIVTLCVLGPMTLFFGLTGNPVFEAISMNVVVVAAVMIAILLIHYREFSDLVASRSALIEQAAQAQQLSDDNDRLANVDSLTGLPNRRRFFAELEAHVARARRHDRSLVVGVIDLDGFKPINDAFGHATGDRLLSEVGRRLQAFHSPPLFAARLGGDEFGLIIDAHLGPDAIKALGRDLCDLMRAPYRLPGVTAQVGGSVGFCAFPAGGQTGEQLFERADYALYHAKQNLKGSAVVFDERHEADIRELGQVEQALRRADLHAEMHIHFQPIIDTSAKRTIAFEALARWSSPELGDVPPAVFINAAERSGQIVEITRVLVAKALRAVSTWPMDMRVSINLSARDIASMETVSRIVDIVLESQVAPHRIDFEITETAIVCDFDQARAALMTFHGLGVRTALDDFGTGHSSLSHVRLLPLDKLKIDSSFIADIDHHAASEDIVKTVLQLCRNLRIDCIVEGVETQAQLDKVVSLGGVVMQGYHFARPMPAASVATYLAEEAAQAFARNGLRPSAAQRAARIWFDEDGLQGLG